MKFSKTISIFICLTMILDTIKSFTSHEPLEALGLSHTIAVVIMIILNSITVLFCSLLIYKSIKSGLKHNKKNKLND